LQTFAINLSLGVNVALLVFKVIALIQSKSISVFSSVVDSALDLFSGFTILVVSRYMKKRNRCVATFSTPHATPFCTSTLFASAGDIEKYIVFLSFGGTFPRKRRT
jgi:Co/Zn/Cd efflux system component